MTIKKVKERNIKGIKYTSWYIQKTMEETLFLNLKDREIVKMIHSKGLGNGVHENEITEIPKKFKQSVWAIQDGLNSVVI